MKIGLGIGIGSGGGAAPWTPLALGSSLALWLRADLGITLNGSTVSAWADQSGNGRHATQGTAGRQPTFRASGLRAINSQPTLDYDAGDSLDFGASAFAALTGGAEIFLVVRIDTDPPVNLATSGLWTFGSSASSTHFPFTDSNVYDDFGSTARKSAGNPTPALTSPTLYGVKSISGEWTARANGTQLFTTATNTVGWSATPSLGQYGGTAFLDGVIAEVIMVAAAGATAGNRAMVHAYISARYGITVA